MLSFVEFCLGMAFAYSPCISLEFAKFYELDQFHESSSVHRVSRYGLIFNFESLVGEELCWVGEILRKRSFQRQTT